MARTNSTEPKDERVKEPLGKRLSQLKEKVDPFLWLVSLVFAFFGGLVGMFVAGWFLVAPYAARTAKDEVLSDRVLAELARKVRPSAIVDSRGNILNDFGATDWIEVPEFTTGPGAYHAQLLVKLKRPVDNAPKLSALTSGIYVHSAERAGGGFSWRYDIRATWVTEDGNPAELKILELPEISRFGNAVTYPLTATNSYTFLIEILH